MGRIDKVARRKARNAVEVSARPPRPTEITPGAPPVRRPEFSAKAADPEPAPRAPDAPANSAGARRTLVGRRGLAAPSLVAAADAASVDLLDPGTLDVLPAPALEEEQPTELGARPGVAPIGEDPASPVASPVDADPAPGVADAPEVDVAPSEGSVADDAASSEWDLELKEDFDDGWFIRDAAPIDVDAPPEEAPAPVAPVATTRPPSSAWFLGPLVGVIVLFGLLASRGDIVPPLSLPAPTPVAVVAPVRAVPAASSVVAPVVVPVVAPPVDAPVDAPVAGTESDADAPLAARVVAAPSRRVEASAPEPAAARPAVVVTPPAAPVDTVAAPAPDAEPAAPESDNPWGVVADE